MSMCDCDECGGVRDCGCGRAAPMSSGASCSGGACSITSQSTAMQRSGTTIHPSAARAFRGTKLSGYDTPQMKVGPRAVPAQYPDISGYSGPIVPPSGQALILSAGQVPPQPIPAPPPPPIPANKMPGAQGGQPQPQPQPQPQVQVGISEQTLQGLLNVGAVGIQGLTSIIVAERTQANETERARIDADARRHIAQLQRQGLLSQQNANDAMLALQNAQAATPPPPPPPQGWWASLSPNAKTAVGVGAAVGVVGIGALIYKATR